MVTGTSALHTLFHQLGKIHIKVRPIPAGNPRLQYFFDSAHQTVGVFEHEAVEVGALRVIDSGLAALEGL